MNWNDEDIDRLFRENSSKVEVNYKEEYWEEVETMLGKKKNYKGFILGGIISSLVLILSLFVTIESTSLESAAKTNFTLGTTHSSQLKEMLPSSQTSTNLIQNQHFTQAPSQGSQVKQKLKVKALENQESSSFLTSVEIQENQVLSVDSSLNSVENLSFLEINELEKIVEKKIVSPMKFVRKNSRLFLTLGAGFSQSFLQKSDNQMPVLSFGLGYSYYRKGWGFSAGITLHNIYANNLNINNQSKVYGFGVTDYEQRIDYKQLYNVEFPLSAEYRTGKHLFTIGVGPTYTFGTLLQYSEQIDEKVTEQSWKLGPKQGLQPFGMKSNVSYQLQINSSISVGVQLSTQLINQIDEDAFKSDNTRLPINGQLVLRKSIF
jgi:hypothetical protein